ncbi:MAG: 5-bromo-4-chloroindolyl phosphate hydrolysis family protein [Eubacteriales bacterium]|nr:5-bromo-4-chloroindolyl phosphate hydrolysis family protein [Eubacteriales bacterium]
MANNNQDWEALGRNIQEIIDQAVNSQDYRKLNQTITKTVNHAIDVGGEAVRRAVDTAARSVDNAARTAQAKQKPVIIEEPETLPALYGSTDGKTAVGIVKIVGGSLLSALGLAGAISAVVFSILMGSGFGTGFFGAAALIGGIGLIFSGVHGLERVSRFKKYCKTLGKNTHCALEKLARSVGKNVKFVRKELVKMIDDGYFLEGHLDKEEANLITSHETYRHYEQSRLALEARKKAELEAAKQAAKPNPSADPRVREVMERGNAFIAQIRRCNDAIPGEEMSGKITRMELIVRRIFERAQAHPEIVPDLKKLMDYYLPMTVKLLNAYAEMDAQPAQGETIRASKKEIEDTLDTLNLAFEKLLDDLFEDTAMDVSSDISVLNTLLAQEGLTDDELSKLKKREI